MRIHWVVLIALVAATSVWATPPNIAVHWRLNSADSNQLLQDTNRLPLLTTEENKLRAFVSDPKLPKSLLLLNLAKSMKEHLDRFAKACPIVYPYHPVLPVPPRPGSCLGQRDEIAAALIESVDALMVPSLQSDADVSTTYKLVLKLADNMKKATIYRPWPPYPPRPIPLPGPGPIPRPVAPIVGGGGVRADSSNFNVTGGGAQDFEFFKKLVSDGHVPAADALPIEGFLGEFDLSLENTAPCDQLICLYPGVVVRPDLKRMYVQIAMGTNIRPDSFHRKNLNLAVVLDISGSMSATDNTEKSRLEWAKETLIRIIDQLDEQDRLSITLFDTDTEVLLAPTPVTEPGAIKAKVAQLHTKGTTNLEKGLRTGLEFVSQYFQSNAENRVILISDAGLNTGVVDSSSILKLVGDYAAEGVGLSAIGVGENFKQDLIHQITMSRGGNYVFVQNGMKMAKLMEQFNLFVSPIAYNLKANLEIAGIKAKLLQSYGIPRKEDEPLRELIDIRTLFLSMEGGGAIILEYALE